jgi:hypothetical protein
MKHGTAQQASARRQNLKIFSDAANSAGGNQAALPKRKKRRTMSAPLLVDACLLPAVAAASSTATTARPAAISIAITEAPAASTTRAPTATVAPTATASGARSAAIARLINLDATALEVGLVERFDCLGGAVLIRHLNESESPRLAGKLVGHHDSFFDRPDLSEQLHQVFVGNCVGEITYVQLAGHGSPPSELVPEALKRDPTRIRGCDAIRAVRAFV